MSDHSTTTQPGAGRSVWFWPIGRRRAGGSAVRGYDFLRIVLGLLLLAVAALKGHQLATEPVFESGLFTSRWFLIGLVEFELFLGLWLLAGLFPRKTWAVALACFAVFGGVSLSRGLAGDASCGCFGNVEVSPWWTFLLDALIVAAMCRFRPARTALAGAAPSEANMHGVATRLTAFVAAALLVGIPSALAMARYAPASLAADGSITGQGDSIVLEPEKWTGKRFPLLPHIDIGNRLSRGQWTVLLYHDDCPKCQEVIARYDRLLQGQGQGLATRGERVALVEIPPYAVDPMVSVDSHSSFVAGRLSDRKQWFVMAPVEIVLEQGLVRSVSEQFKLTDSARRGLLHMH